MKRLKVYIAYIAFAKRTEATGTSVHGIFFDEQEARKSLAERAARIARYRVLENGFGPEELKGDIDKAAEFVKDRIIKNGIYELEYNDADDTTITFDVAWMIVQGNPSKAVYVGEDEEDE